MLLAIWSATPAAAQSCAPWQLVAGNSVAYAGNPAIPAGDDVTVRSRQAADPFPRLADVG